MGTLIERQADKATAEQALKDHRLNCSRCIRRGGRCTEGRDLADQLADARADVRDWFRPGPEQGTLI
jgi:hypothetical protein